MEASPLRSRRPEQARRYDAPRVVVPRRAEAPLRKPEANLRNLDSLVRRPTLAIDLGSSGSSAILVTTEVDILIEDPDLGHPVWPTKVAFDGVAPRTGGAAESFSRVRPTWCHSRLKQLLGEPGEVALSDRRFRPVELVSWLFGAMRAQAERVGGVEVTRAVVTVPVGFLPDDPRRVALLEAAALAGFTTVELLYEPLATVAAPLIGGPLEAGDIALICDLGAGSFTATLVSLLKNGTVELLGFCEQPECSGAQMDRLIMTELLTRAGRGWADLTAAPHDEVGPLRAARALRELESRAQTMKHQLSAHPTAIELIGPDDVPVELTNDELTGLVAPLLFRAAGNFRDVLTSSGVRPGELASVVLSGGGSRMPAVADVVAETFHRPVRTTLDRHRAVAEGAARFARSIERRQVRARVATDRETPLRWDIPDGRAMDLHWLKAPGSRFGASDALAVVRAADGALWELRAGRAGTLVRTHVSEGSQVATGDWLVTVELDVRPFR